MKTTEQLRIAGIVVLVVILAFLFLRKPVPESKPAGSAPGVAQSASLIRTDADGKTWALDRAGGVMLSTDPNGPKAGPPILVKTNVIPAGQAVSIGLVLEGQAGEQYQPVVKKSGSPLSAPTLRIVNEAGQVIAQGSFQYG
jgi:hypothetical protein